MGFVRRPAAALTLTNSSRKRMRTRLREILVTLMILTGFALLAAGTIDLREHMQTYRAERQAAFTEHPAR